MKDPTWHLQSPGDQPVTARLAAAGSRLQELRALLGAAGPDTSTRELRALVIDDNVTNKRSAISRDKVWRQLSTRYLLDPSASEFQAFVRGMHSADPAEQGLLACLMFARTDRLFRETTLRMISEKLARDGVPIDPASVEASVQALVAEQGARWSPTTIRRVQQHVFAALKDFGLIKGSRTRRSMRPRVGLQATLFAVRLGRLEGLTDRQILDGCWFRLLGLDYHHTVDVVYAAARTGVLAFRLQADVAEFDLPALDPA